MPDFRRETVLGAPETIIAGIDEAGRGPLAGPVVAAAVVLDPRALPKSLVRRIDDSKRLARKQREQVFAALCDCVEFGIGQSSVTEIDTINILEASLLAMQRAVSALPREPEVAIVDGNRAPKLSCTTETLIGGDGLCLSVAAASIIAKVTRDRLMDALNERYPGYGWNRNAGYGTREHMAALLDIGVTPEHRTSFRPVSELLSIRD